MLLGSVNRSVSNKLRVLKRIDLERNCVTYLYTKLDWSLYSFINFFNLQVTS